MPKKESIRKSLKEKRKRTLYIYIYIYMGILAADTIEQTEMKVKKGKINQKS